MAAKKINSAGCYGSYAVTAGQAPWAWESGSQCDGAKYGQGALHGQVAGPEVMTIGRCRAFEHAWEDWRKAESIREFCRALEVNSASGGEPDPWISFGLALADGLDPLVNGRRLDAEEFRALGP